MAPADTHLTPTHRATSFPVLLRHPPLDAELPSAGDPSVELSVDLEASSCHIELSGGVDGDCGLITGPPAPILG